MTYGKSIELFLANGTADSLVTAGLPNWNGKAIKIPRIEVGSCAREHIKLKTLEYIFSFVKTMMTKMMFTSGSLKTSTKDFVSIFEILMQTRSFMSEYCSNIY